MKNKNIINSDGGSYNSNLEKNSLPNQLEALAALLEAHIKEHKDKNIKTKIFYDFGATSVSKDADMISIGLVAVTEKEIDLGDDIPEGFSPIPIKTFKNGIGVIQQIKTFYAEFKDFEVEKCDNWVKENIIKKLKFKDYLKGDKSLIFNYLKTSSNFELVGDTLFVSGALKSWLSQFESIEFWADFDVIDKPMLIDLIGEFNTVGIKCKLCSHLSQMKFSEYQKVGLPTHLSNVQYDQFFDLHTYLKIKGFNTDVSRIKFIGDLINEIPGGQSHNALYDAYVNWKVYEKLNN